MKRVLVSVTVNRWVEVADDADTADILYNTAGVFAGIDGSVWEMINPEITDEETAE